MRPPDLDSKARPLRLALVVGLALGAVLPGGCTGRAPAPVASPEPPGPVTAAPAPEPPAARPPSVDPRVVAARRTEESIERVDLSPLMEGQPATREPSERGGGGDPSGAAPAPAAAATEAVVLPFTAAESALPDDAAALLEPLVARLRHDDSLFVELHATAAEPAAARLANVRAHLLAAGVAAERILAANGADGADGTDGTGADAAAPPADDQVLVTLRRR